MDCPLRKARLLGGQTLQDVASAVGSDTGNISRIERGLQWPAKWLIERLVKHFDGKVTEMEILFPERFVSSSGESV